MWSHARRRVRRTLSCKLVHGAAVLAAMGGAALPAAAEAAHLQCVPYAREVSGIDIHGNARTWWNQAEGIYARGQEPRVGAVLAFKGTRAMPYGHVATVARVIDDRHVLLDHANWSRPGMIEHSALAVDVSEAGDWSEVRVWFAPSQALGARDNPTFGFIYDDAPGAEPATLAGDALLARGIDAPSVALASADPATIATGRTVLASAVD